MLPLPLSPMPPTQRRWAPGTQCITKCEHTRTKPGELAFRKGDVVTILEACEVSCGLRAWVCLGMGLCQEYPPPATIQTPGSLPGRARAGIEPSTTPAGRRGCWQPVHFGNAKLSQLTPNSASCRELWGEPWDGGSGGLGQLGPTRPPATAGGSTGRSQATKRCSCCSHPRMGCSWCGSQCGILVTTCCA